MTTAPPSQSAAPRVGFALALAAVALLGVFKAVAADTADPDSFWHLRVADQLVRDGIGPLVDSLSYRSLETPWTPYSWLGELVMRAVWQAGGFRLALVAQALCSATVIVCAGLACVPASRRDGTACFGLCVALAAFVAFFSLAYLSFRPVTFSLAGLAICVWLVERDRARRGRAVWLVPLLVVLMINLHLTAVFAAALMLARLAGERTRRAAALAVLSCGALACTPMLRGMIQTAWHYQTRDALVAAGVISEMKPFYSGPVGVVMAVIAAGLVGSLIARRKRLDLGDGCVVLVACGALLRWGRFAPVFALLIAPVMARALATRPGTLLGTAKIRYALAGLVAIQLSAIVIHYPGPSVSFDHWLNRNGPDAPGYPTDAAAYVQAYVRPSHGKLINEFSWGGYLAWRLPQFRVFSDGRTQLYSTAYWQAAWLGSAAEKRALLEQEPADAAVVPARRSAYFETLRQMGWTVIFEDERARVLVPPAANFSPARPASPETAQNLR